MSAKASQGGGGEAAGRGRGLSTARPPFFTHSATVERRPGEGLLPNLPRVGVLRSCSKGVCMNLDAGRSTSANDQVKKVMRKARKNNGRKPCPNEHGTDAFDLPKFLDGSTFEDGCSTEEGLPDVGTTESQQPPSEFAKKSASKKRRATSTNGIVSINGKSPFFTHPGISCDTSCVNQLMPIKPTSNTERGATVIRTYATKCKKGAIQKSEITSRQVDGASQPSASQPSGDPVDVKDADCQLVHTTDSAIVCIDKNISSKTSRKAKRSIYFETPTRPLGQRDISNTRWVPPVSVHALIQEELYRDPWKVLVACMLLNKTAGTQMRKAIWDLFALCPTPEAVVATETEKIEEVIRHLGLQRKRARMIQRFSRDYLGKEWTNVGQLHGIGKYATDAYAIFCEGRWQEVKPEDHKLVDYWKYLCATDGVGYAFKDDREKGLASAAPPLEV